MSTCVKRLSEIALILWIVALPLQGSDIKLRVYLKDGSVQSGNLITESGDNFVVLTKEGRIEIPKSKIMFVNGKTLAQWEAQPQKNYQTEIIPSEIPKPGYVTDLEKLVAPPAIVPVQKPVQVEVPAKAVEKKAAEKPAVAAPAPEVPLKPQAVEAAAPNAEEKPPAAPVVARKKAKKPAKLAHPTSAEKPGKIAKAPKKEIAASPAYGGRFNREHYFRAHYQRGLDYLVSGQRGLALQELHKANTLNKWDQPTALLLGKLYVEEGVYPRARKYLELPGLKNTEEVTKLVHFMDQTTRRAQQKPWFLLAGALGGLFAPLPVLGYLRRRRRLVVDQATVITAETIEELAEPPVEHQPEPEKIPVVEPVVSFAAPVAPVPVPEPKPFVPEVIHPVVQPVQIEAPASIASPLPVKPQGPPPFEWPQPPAEPPRIEIPIERPLETPPPVPVFSFAEKAKDDRAIILKMGRVADEALTRGNDYAGQERWEKALKEYRTVLALEPHRAEGYLGMAYVNFAKGLWETALQYYVKALEVNPQSADATYGIGRVLYETDRVEEASEAFQHTLSLDPTFDDARAALNMLGKAA